MSNAESYADLDEWDHNDQQEEALKGCQAPPLRRTYWRVFLRSPNSASLYPRPDGQPELQPVCTDPHHKLHLIVSHYLHTQLKFRASQDLSRVIPTPSSRDTVATCAVDAEPLSPSLESLCKKTEQKLIEQKKYAILITGPVNMELANRLNLLYGIDH